MMFCALIARIVQCTHTRQCWEPRMVVVHASQYSCTEATLVDQYVATVAIGTLALYYAVQLRSWVTLRP